MDRPFVMMLSRSLEKFFERFFAKMIFLLVLAWQCLCVLPRKNIVASTSLTSKITVKQNHSQKRSQSNIVE